MPSRRGSWRLLSALLAALPWIQGSAAQERPEAKDEPLRPEWCRQLPRPGYAQLERVTQPDPWFEVYRIRPGVFALYEPRQYEEVISYLVVGSRRALLLDTGIGIGDLRAVVSRLTDRPVVVLNSHTHFDHIGNNWQFQSVLGVDGPFTRRSAAGASHDAVAEVVLPERICGELPPGFEAKTYATRPFRISRVVEDGQVIDLGSRRLEVLLTPGHAPDALCLLDRANKLLFTGDTFYPGPIFLYVPETDLDAYGRSVERLAALVPQLDLLLPAHNVPSARPEMLTRLVQAFHEVRSGKARFTLSEGRREYGFDGFSFLLAGE